jgi:predicted ArsR family transcriptional regulator
MLIMAKLTDQIELLLKNSGKPMTLIEIAEELGKPSKGVFRALQKLFSEEKINCDIRNRTYSIAKE